MHSEAVLLTADDTLNRVNPSQWYWLSKRKLWKWVSMCFRFRCYQSRLELACSIV